MRTVPDTMADVVIPWLSGKSTIVVGVEDDPETGMLRMYVGARWRGVYALIEDPEDQETLRREWADPTRILVVPKPEPDQLFKDE